MTFELDQESFREYLSEDSTTLLAGFAGIQVSNPVPSFHYLRAFAGAPANRLHVRDVRQMFYQRGIPGAGDHAGAVGEFLRRYVARRHFEKCIFLGGSAGGYAALLFGWFTGADEVHAFAPLTFLPSRTKAQLLRLIPERRLALAKAIAPLHYDLRIDRRYFDLHEVLATDNGRTRYHLYYGTGHARDVANAERMADLPGVVLHAYDTAEHHVSTLIRDSGEMAWIIDRACRQASSSG